jgi:hypothetical protein
MMFTENPLLSKLFKRRFDVYRVHSTIMLTTSPARQDGLLGRPGSVAQFDPLAVKYRSGHTVASLASKELTERASTLGFVVDRVQVWSVFSTNRTARNWKQRDYCVPGAVGTANPVRVWILQRLFSFPGMLVGLLLVLAVYTVRSRFNDPDLCGHLKVHFKDRV